MEAKVGQLDTCLAILHHEPDMHFATDSLDASCKFDHTTIHESVLDPLSSKTV